MTNFILFLKFFQARDLQLAIILIFIVCMFLITNFPRVLINLYELIVVNKILSCGKDFLPPVWYLCATSLNHVLLILNSLMKLYHLLLLQLRVSKHIICKMFGNRNPEYEVEILRSSGVDGNNQTVVRRKNDDNKSEIDADDKCKTGQMTTIGNVVEVDGNLNIDHANGICQKTTLLFTPSAKRNRSKKKASRVSLFYKYEGVTTSSFLTTTKEQ